jgi:hypothetical protein
LGRHGKRLSREIKELIKPEDNSGDFTRIWEERIKEKPDAVEKAVIVTQRAVLEGKNIRSIGGTLNSNYERAVKGNLWLSYEEEKRVKLRREMDEAHGSNEEKKEAPELQSQEPPKPQKVKAHEAAPAAEEKPSSPSLDVLNHLRGWLEGQRIPGAEKNPQPPENGAEAA